MRIENIDRAHEEANHTKKCPSLEYYEMKGKYNPRKYFTFNGIYFLDCLLFHREMILPILEALKEKYNMVGLKEQYDDLFEEESKDVFDKLKEVCPETVYVALNKGKTPHSRTDSKLMEIASGYMIWNSRDGGKGATYEFFAQKGVINSEDHRQKILKEIKDCFWTQDYHNWEEGRDDLTSLQWYIMKAPIGQVLDKDYRYLSRFVW